MRNVSFQALPDLQPLAGPLGYCRLKEGKLAVVVGNNGPVTAAASVTEVRFQTASGPQSVQLPTPAIPAGERVGGGDDLHDSVRLLESRLRL